MAVRLTAAADKDLLRIFEDGIQEFGVTAAVAYLEDMDRCFALLAQFPAMARERLEIVDPVRAHPFRSHVIVYETVGSDVLILRVRHGREDWQHNLN